MYEENWSLDDPCYIYHGKIVPYDFPYICILVQGRPRHCKDSFSSHYPQMERGKRAKIFAPFDALDGYSDCLASKRVQYCKKIELDDAEKEELNRRLSILHGLTFNSRMARANRVYVQIRYYVPCNDPNSFFYGIGGKYITISGIVKKVDMDVAQTITIGDEEISFEDILSVTAEDERLFQRKWDDEVTPKS